MISSGLIGHLARMQTLPLPFKEQRANPGPTKEISCRERRNSQNPSFMGGTVTSWLVRSFPDRAVGVQALGGVIVLCSWARHFTLIVPLSTQVYKWVPAKVMLGVTLRWTSISSRGGVEILLVASCYRNRDKLRPDGPLGWYADLSFLYFFYLPFPELSLSSTMKG